MTISPKYATRLIQSGKASDDGRTYDGTATWAIVTRHDLMRTDHYLIGYGDLRRYERHPGPVPI